MEQSLLAAVSGIEANQTYLNVVGNNVANSNTTGYKSETADFTDLLAEQIAGASAPPGNSQGAGVNPIAVGAGVRIGAVQNDLSQGSLIQTNQPTDVAIQGQGYLVAVQNGQTLYTRAGNLTLDANGDLATATGGLIQGWAAQPNGTIANTGQPGPVTIPTGTTMGAMATARMALGGNLPATTWDGTGTAPSYSVDSNAYDALGNSVPLVVTFQAQPPTAPSTTVSTWKVSVGPVGSQTALGNISFDSSGNIVIPAGTTTDTNGDYQLFQATVGTQKINIDFPPKTSTSAVTGYAGGQSLSVKSDGYASGSLSSFSIGSDGVITGSFSNGQTLPIGQIAMATFANPGGLADQGNLMYASTANSGQANLGAPGSGGRGSLIGGSLEGSNVDLATQLTDLIVAQEAYQANTKVVSTTASNLQALTQMA